MAGPAHGEPDDLVADSESGDAGTDLDHDPGKVTALPGREGRRKHVAHSTRADRRLTDVDAGGPDLDQNLTGSRNRAGHVAHLEDVDAAVRIELDCFGHGPASWRRPPVGASGKSIVPTTRSGWLTDLGDKGVELHDHPVGAAGDVKAGDDRWLVGRAEVEAEMAEVVIDRYWAGRSEHPAGALGLQFGGPEVQGLAPVDNSVRLVPHDVVGVDHG